MGGVVQKNDGFLRWLPAGPTVDCQLANLEENETNLTVFLIGPGEVNSPFAFQAKPVLLFSLIANKLLH